MAQIFEWLGLACLPAFLLLDLVWRHRKYDTTRFWRLRAMAVTVFNLALSLGVSVFWGSVWAGTSLFDGSVLGVVGGSVVGILVYGLAHYWYHRSVHRYDFLWRAAHQMHHSAEAVDAWGAVYLHPLDVILFTTTSSLVLFPLLGLNLEAGAIVGAFLLFNTMFQHANIRTPRWLGYLIQRPESHGIHHQRGVHRYNYSDLPLWDIVFGTFNNPETFDAPVGFYKGASARVPEMLIGRLVDQPVSTGEVQAEEAAAEQPALAEAA